MRNRPVKYSAGLFSFHDWMRRSGRADRLYNDCICLIPALTFFYYGIIIYPQT